MSWITEGSILRMSSQRDSYLGHVSKALFTSACSIVANIASVVARGAVTLQSGGRTVGIIRLTEGVPLTSSALYSLVSLQAQLGHVIHGLTSISVTAAAG